jgi:hypothetical protein
MLCTTRFLPSRGNADHPAAVTVTVVRRFGGSAGGRNGTVHDRYNRASVASVASTARRPAPAPGTGSRAPVPRPGAVTAAERPGSSVLPDRGQADGTGDGAGKRQRGGRRQQLQQREAGDDADGERARRGTAGESFVGLCLRGRSNRSSHRITGRGPRVPSGVEPARPQWHGTVSRCRRPERRSRPATGRRGRQRRR